MVFHGSPSRRTDACHFPASAHAGVLYNAGTEAMESYLNAEISAAAVRANLAAIRGLLDADTRICAVVKADCYGHGLSTLLRTIASEADCLGVATPEEAIGLRDLGYDGPILMFFSACAYTDGQELRDALEALLRRGVTLTVVAGEEARSVARAALRLRTRADLHVKVDTGMHRSGCLPEDVPRLVEQIRAEDALNLRGFYTHFASADEADKSVALEQLERFRASMDQCGIGAETTRHAANSAAAIDLPPARLDMIRPGIAIYGYQPSDQMHTRLRLRPALRLTGRLMQMKTVPAGSRCGYGMTYTFRRPSRVGLVPVGYADGYLRCLGNRDHAGSRAGRARPGARRDGPDHPGFDRRAGGTDRRRSGESSRRNPTPRTVWRTWRNWPRPFPTS